jgi:hypothetical protein
VNEPAPGNNPGPLEKRETWASAAKVPSACESENNLCVSTPALDRAAGSERGYIVQLVIHSFDNAELLKWSHLAFRFSSLRLIAADSKEIASKFPASPRTGRN